MWVRFAAAQRARPARLLSVWAWRLYALRVRHRDVTGLLCRVAFFHPLTVVQPPLASRAITMSWRGRISENVRELRWFYCPNSTRGHGLRQFLGKNYEDLKTLNPSTPLLVRSRDGAPTQLWASYDFGVEEVRDLDGASEAQVEQALRELVAKVLTAPSPRHHPLPLAPTLFVSLQGAQLPRFKPQVRGDYLVDAYDHRYEIFNDGLKYPESHQ